LLVAAFVFSASVASAAPATITAAAAEVHAAPFKSTPVLHTFGAGDKVSAEEEAHDGWRRVHTPDGRVGFVRDEELRLDGAPVPAPSKPAAAPFPTTPAKVKTFELPARSAPVRAAPVLQSFAEGDVLAVSEDDNGGFRRVMLPDGRIAFVESASLTIGPASATPATAGAAPAAAPATPTAAPVEPLLSSGPKASKPTIYVKDLDHLAQLVRSDDVVHPMAESLATRRNAAVGVIIGGSIVGLGLMVLSFTAFTHQDCTDLGFGNPVCTTEPNMGAMIAGGAISIGALLVGLAVQPKRVDLLDVINTWNTRHVDSQFTIDSHEVSGGH
jgi:hypothetical protein